MSHNAERDWSGRSYRKGGERVRDLRDAAEVKSWREGGKFPTFTPSDRNTAQGFLPENKLSWDRFERVEREIAYMAANAAPLPEWTNAEYFSTIRAWDRAYLERAGYRGNPRLNVNIPLGYHPLFGYCW